MRALVQDWSGAPHVPCTVPGTLEIQGRARAPAPAQEMSFLYKNIYQKLVGLVKH